MKIFQPIRIGSLELKNRLVMAPMATHYANENVEGWDVGSKATFPVVN